MTLSTGQILISRYRIVKRMAQGGFGAIYRGWDLNLKKACAIKENFETSPHAQHQFEREALLLANLNHQSLPKVIDHFVLPGQGQYLVMDFIEGEDLQEMLDRTGGSLPEGLILPWIEQICEALIYLHSQNPPIIHRDIKPANIKITPQGKAVLVDFGIAKAYDTNLSTTVGARAVTPGYSPQEQYGQGKTDARSDEYALGATLYILLTGQVPPESIDRNLGTPLIPPRQINPKVSPSVETATLKAMEPNPSERYPNVDTFRNALRTNLISVPVGASLSGKQTGQETSAKRVTVWLGIGLAGILIIGCVLIFWGIKTLGWWPTPTASPTPKSEASTDTHQPENSPIPLTSDTPTSSNTPTLQPSSTLTPVPSNTPTVTFSETPVPTAGPTASIFYPKDGSILPSRKINVTGNIANLAPGQRAFLCIQSTVFGELIWPQGEIKPDSSEEWMIEGIYQSVGYNYKTYVVITDNLESIKILADPNNRTYGIAELPAETFVISAIIVNMRK